MNSTRHRWLVVDDDRPLLRMTADSLRTVPGADVTACPSPQLALDAFLADPSAFDLVVTDFKMPGMDGVELVRCLRQHSSRFKALLVTGTPLHEAAAPPGELQALLPKPFSRTALLGTVQKILGGDEDGRILPRDTDRADDLRSGADTVNAR